MHLPEAIEWLYGLQHFGIKLGLDSMRALLAEMGEPQRAYRAVHVAGTNGKGSVAAAIDALLLAHGVRSALYTSPHLVRPHERMRILGRDIGSDELASRLSRMRERIEAGLAAGRLEAHPSFFEVVTAVALETFRDHGIEAAVLEVGLGGRLDATNVVDAEVGVIVGIDLDHTRVLGATLAEIADEKAGIVKPGMVLVNGAVQQSAVDRIRLACERRGARFVEGRAAVELSAEDGRGGLTLRTERGMYSELHLALEGRHQIDNARLALAAFEEIASCIGLVPEADRVRDGLANVRWPGRLQWVDWPDGAPRVLVDGAHNPAGIAALVRYVRSLGGAPPVLLFGATAGRPLDELVDPLSSIARGAVITRPPVDRAVDPRDIAELARRALDPVVVEPDPRAAIARARKLAGPERFVLVAGSLYLVGSILGMLETEDVPGPVAM